MSEIISQKNMETKNCIIRRDVENIITINETKSQEKDSCLICLDELSDEKKIKPCGICNMFMDKECLYSYVVKNNKHRCPICNGDFNTQNICNILQYDITESNNINNETCEMCEKGNLVLCLCSIFLTAIMTLIVIIIKYTPFAIINNTGV